MKTYKYVGIIALVLLCTACATAYYQVDTQVHKNGTVSRTVYAWGDSAYIAGDVSLSPFHFPLDGWKRESLDSPRTIDYWGENKRWNVKVSRQASYSDQFAVNGSNDNPLAAPRESLQKKFRWFYTYYIYTGTFSEILDKGPVPIDRYLTKQEQALWFRGDISAYPDLNGVEMNDVLDKLKDKFWDWYRYSLFEVSYSVIQEKVKMSAESVFSDRLIVAKDSLYALHKEKEKKEKDEFMVFSSSPIEDDVCSPEMLCTYFDEYFHTDYFSKLYQQQEEGIEALFNEKCHTARLFEYVFKYRMNMPGELLSANTGYFEEDALVWKVNAFRLMAGDYTLTAKSRVCNTWAFVVTFLLMIIAIGGFWKLYKK